MNEKKMLELIKRNKVVAVLKMETPKMIVKHAQRA